MTENYPVHAKDPLAEEAAKVLSYQGSPAMAPPILTPVSQMSRAFAAEVARLTSDREQARSIAVTLEQENARLTAELAKYVGKEPTVAEEMQYLGSCLDAVHEVCDAAEKGAARWETPLPVPEWVAPVREAAEGQRPNDPADNRRRIYLDGKGNAWLSVAMDVDGTEYIAPIDSPHNGDQPTGTVRETTGSLREIGRTP